MIDKIYEDIVQEDLKRSLGTSIALLGLGVGGAAMSAGAAPKTTQVKQEVDSVENVMGKELPMIIKAAKRNGVEPNTDDFAILLAIRKSENGGKGIEFGILHPKAKGTNLDVQAGWAAATIKKNRERWEKAGKKEPFIQFLSKRYCPVGAENDPNGLNVNWVKNVTKWFEKFRSMAV